MDLNFILEGQTLKKSKNFPLVVEKSKDFLRIVVDGIPNGYNSVAYFRSSWENEKTYDLIMDGNSVVVDEYLTTLPENPSEYVDYILGVSIAGVDEEGKRFTTNIVDIVLDKTAFSSETDNTPEIPQSQFDAIVEIFNEKVAELDGGDAFVTIAEITLDEAVNAITIDESTFPNFIKVKDFYITFDIAKPTVTQEGKLYVRCKTQDGNKPLIAVIETWSHASYVLSGSLYSKWFEDNFRFNMYQEKLAANATTPLNVSTTLSRAETPVCGIEINCTKSASLIPAGTKITIKGFVGK